jgi:hypothetical protein
MGTSIEKLLFKRVPLAEDTILVPLGRPTVISIDGEILFR